MAFGVIFRSNLAFTMRAHNEIGKQALFAAAEVVRKQAIKNAQRGMTSGAYVGQSDTPLYQNIWKVVALGRGTARTDNRLSTQGNSGKKIDKGIAYVGTQVKHGAYWEEGHYNVHLKRYIRVLWLTHAFRSTAAEQQKKAEQAAERAARRFGKMGLERLAGLTPIGSLRSTIG